MRTVFQAATVMAGLGLALVCAGRAECQQYRYYGDCWPYATRTYVAAPVISGGSSVIIASAYDALPTVYRARPTYAVPATSYWVSGYSAYPSAPQWSYARPVTWTAPATSQSAVAMPSYSRPSEPQYVGLRRYHEWYYNPKAPGGPNH